KNRGSRQKQIIPKNLIDSRSLKHIVGLTRNGRTSKLVFHPHQRKKPRSISAQFQASLCNLLETIGKAEPFFIRCIRSNAEKKEMHFDDELVLRQIKYSGMLEMVRIQKAGFGAKYTFEVFLKESERQHLHDTLNREVMRRIIILQRWFRACLIRTHFLHKKDAAMLIQRSWREFYENNQTRAAVIIQSAWRTSLKKSQSASQLEGGGKMSTKRSGRQSLVGRELRRQAVIEHSPNRSQQADPLGD
ncbi:hypothetical protein CRUP_024063, partial [Coryphaenoides rupestris]